MFWKKQEKKKEKSLWIVDTIFIVIFVLLLASFVNWLYKDFLNVKSKVIYNNWAKDWYIKALDDITAKAKNEKCLPVIIWDDETGISLINTKCLKWSEKKQNQASNNVKKRNTIIKNKENSETKSLKSKNNVIKK